MFSQLGPLFKTAFRKTEHADARLEIRREEKDTPKKKDEETEESLSDDDLWQDSTTVSLQALRTFLLDFLKNNGEATPEEEIMAREQVENFTPAPHASPTNTAAMRAHKAYANMASYGQTPIAPPENPAEKTVNLSDLLAVDEVRTMHVLIAELDILHKRGVETLVIEKADSFLQALVLAVEKIKS